jgi:hypothetical protein
MKKGLFQNRTLFMFGLDTKKPPMQNKGGLTKSLKTIIILLQHIFLQPRPN